MVDRQVLAGIAGMARWRAGRRGGSSAMFEQAIRSTSGMEGTMVNICTTYPGGRKLLRDAQLVLPAKHASEKAIAKLGPRL
eukprot:2021351-Lingulodinium_polyedra.AAC.1